MTESLPAQTACLVPEMKPWLSTSEGVSLAVPSGELRKETWG